MLIRLGWLLREGPIGQVDILDSKDKLPKLPLPGGLITVYRTITHKVITIHFYRE
jgi:hypothetical protein